MLVDKATLVVVEVIDGWNLSSRPITHETKALMVIIGSNSNKVVFNVISSPINPIIIRLSWLVLHDFRVDWKMKSLHFESENETTHKYEASPTSTLNFQHDSAHEDPTRTNQCMQKLKHEINIEGNQGSKHFKHLFVKAKIFIKTTKKDMHFLCMPFQPLILGHNNMRSLFNTKITKVFLKRKM